MSTRSGHSHERKSREISKVMAMAARDFPEVRTWPKPKKPAPPAVEPDTDRWPLLIAIPFWFFSVGLLWFLIWRFVRWIVS